MFSGTKLRTIRIKSNMSPAELAGSVGVVRPTILSWEGEASQPSASKLQILARVFNVDLDFFFDSRKGSK